MEELRGAGAVTILPLLLLLTQAFGILLLAALAQAVTGFGAALVAVPLLTLIVGPADAVVAAAGVGLLISVGGFLRERRHVDRPTATRFGVLGVLGMPAGLALLTVLSQRSLSLLIGCVVLILATLMLTSVRLPDVRAVRDTAGLASGALLTSTGMSGPPLVLALSALEPRKYRATLQAVFVLHGVFGLIGLALVGRVTDGVILLVVIGAMAFPLGWRLGDAIFRRVSERVLSLVVSLSLAGSAAAVIASAW